MPWLYACARFFDQSLVFCSLAVCVFVKVLQNLRELPASATYCFFHIPIAFHRCRASVLTLLIVMSSRTFALGRDSSYELVLDFLPVTEITNPASVFGMANNDWTEFSKSSCWSLCAKRWFFSLVRVTLHICSHFHDRRLAHEHSSC